MAAQEAFGAAFRNMIHLSETEPRSQYELAVEMYMTSTSTWVQTMGPYVDLTLQSLVLDPSQALLIITKRARGTVDKRGRKLVDYDRTRDAVKKAKEKLDSSHSADVNKLVKVTSLLPSLHPPPPPSLPYNDLIHPLLNLKPG